MKIKFADLSQQYTNLKVQIDLAINNVIQDNAFIGARNNEYVRKFEDEYSRWLGIKQTVGCGNGTDALEIILEAWDIGRGDEVIVPALSWFSTAEAVINRGAKPVFVDVCLKSSNIDPNKIEECITSKTKAIIPVHLYGQMAHMEKIMEIANIHNLKVLEDCAQAHGAERFNRKAGTWGHASTFSFYPGKNLGAYGDAGAICTNDEELAEICRQIANHGQIEKHNHIRSGRNSRLDGLHAAILSVKLPYIDEWNEQRGKLAILYQSKLESLTEIQLPIPDDHNKHIYHLMVIHHKQRNELARYLRDKGIETALHYPNPLTSLPATKKYIETNKQYSTATSLCNTLLSIPMFPELTESEISYVSEHILAFFSND
jgi:dTDP-4-amino-4,6-dideoxygalactose transaminase